MHHIPNTDCLILIGKMMRTVIVVRLDNVGVGTKVVLGAAIGCKIFKVTGVLSYLKVIKRLFSLYHTRCTFSGRFLP